MKLKSRQKQIPGGMRFYISPLKWSSQPWSSFETIVNEAIAVLQANPHVAKSLQWDISHDAMAERVDEWNAALCKSQGWTQYYVEGGTGSSSAEFPFAPSRQPGLLQSLKRSVVGVRTIAEMFGSEGPTTADVAEKRAAICATCPLNDKGDWTRFFTVPASNSIREALSVFEGTKLKTSFDDELKLCVACGCPNKLKVFARIDHIMKHIQKESFDALAENCWIRTEKGQA